MKRFRHNFTEAIRLSFYHIKDGFESFLIRRHRRKVEDGMKPSIDLTEVRYFVVDFYDDIIRGGFRWLKRQIRGLVFVEILSGWAILRPLKNPFELCVLAWRGGIAIFGSLFKREKESDEYPDVES